jgi:glutamate synthase (NADPH/NADH) small chain
MAAMKASEKMKLPRAQMPEQSIEARSSCFVEVNLGLEQGAAAVEATRCLQCKKAECVEGCPVGVDIPGFVDAVANGDLERAADILYKDNVLPGITGRVCPQEIQCEVKCVLAKKHDALAVGYL